jgi:hypothetical protein
LGRIDGQKLLAEVAKARGMTQVARDAGLGRESLYKALAPGSHPRFETITAILRAIGVRLVAQAPAAAARVKKTGASAAAAAKAKKLSAKKLAAKKESRPSRSRRVA